MPDVGEGTTRTVENLTSMGASSISTTRSIAVGLSLAMVSASSLVMFSYVAGSANDPRPSYVKAASPGGSVTPVILGTSVAQTDPDDGRARDGGIRPDGPPSVPVVLGTRIEEDNGDNPEPKEPDGDGSKLGEPKRADDDPSFKRREPSSDDEGKKKHSPNGHAYGYHRTRSGEDRGSREGDRKGGGGSEGHGPPGKPASTGHGNGHGASNGHGNARGHGKKH